MRYRRFVLLAILALLLLGGLHVYLGSSSVREQIREWLRGRLGVEVAVASARVGIVGTSSAHGVAVQERDQAVTAAAPWLHVPRALLELSLLGILGGHAPAGVDLHEPTLHLRFAESGQLLTALPRFESGTGSTAPPIRIHQGRLILDQAGRKPFVLTGLEGEIQSRQESETVAGGCVITGTITDPAWGVWDLHADYQPRDRRFVVQLKTLRADLTPEHFRSLPFVSPRVWQSVEVGGTTAAALTLTIPIGTPGVRYRIDLDVVRADLYVPTIELRANDVAGRVLIENGIVQLQHVAGDYGGGHLETTARLDFSRPPSQMQFNIQARDVLLTGLPRSWKLPGQLSGQVDLTADLLVRLEPTGVRTTGKGTGTIRQAVFASLPTPPLSLQLIADGSRFRLRPILPSLFSFPAMGIEPR